MAAPLSWKFGVTGADAVRSEIRSVSETVKQNTNTTMDNAKSLRQQARDAGTVINADRLRSRILIAQHPNLLRVIRYTHDLASISRTLLAIQNAYNIAQLVTQKNSSELIDVQNELAQKQRELAILESGGINTPEQLEKQKTLQEDINELKARTIEVTNQEKDSQFQTALGFVTSSALIVGSIVPIATKYIPQIITAITGMAGVVSTFLVPALVPLLLAGTAIAAVIGSVITAIALIAYFASTPGDSVTEFFKQFGIDLTFASVAIDAFVNAIVQGFLSLPGLVYGAFLGFWNGLIGMANGGINAIIGGVETLANSIVNSINRIIDGLNSVNPFGKISKIATVSLPRVNIPTIAAARGFEGTVSSPTMFLAGEAGGAEHVSISPGIGANKPAAAGSSNTIIINVHGSILTENEVSDKVLKELKTRLKGVGFR